MTRERVQDRLLLRQVMEAFGLNVTDIAGVVGRGQPTLSLVLHERACLGDDVRQRCITLLVQRRAVTLAQRIEHGKGAFAYADLFCDQAVKKRGASYLDHLTQCVRCQAKLLIDRKKVPAYGKVIFHSREQ